MRPGIPSVRQGALLRTAASLGAPITPSTDKACLPGEARDASGRCFPIQTVEAQCVAEGFRTDDGVCHEKPYDWAPPQYEYTTKYSYNGTTQWLIDYVDPVYDHTLKACTQVYYRGDCGASAGGVKPTNKIRRTWLPTVMVAASSAQGLLEACPSGQFRDTDQTCKCLNLKLVPNASGFCECPDPKTTWNQSQMACVAKFVNPCNPKTETYTGGKCVKKSGIRLGPGGSEPTPGAAATASPTTTPTRFAAARSGAVGSPSSLAHRVRSGDRLSTIAALYRVPVEAVLEANPSKPRARALGGAVVFASLSFGETIVIPTDTHSPPPCLDVNARMVQGKCVCLPGHFVAPTGHCMKPVSFLPPRQTRTFTSLVGVMELAPGITMTTAQAMTAAKPPACPAGSKLDPTGELCLDPNAMPPLAAAGCPAGTAPDIGSKYCVAPGQMLPSASGFCDMVKQPDGSALGWTYYPDFGLCLPFGFSGGDTVPDGASCSASFPFYDSPSGTCMRPAAASPYAAPGTAPTSSPWAVAPTCGDSTMTWDAQKRACVSPPAVVPVPTPPGTDAENVAGVVGTGLALVGGVLLFAIGLTAGVGAAVGAGVAAVAAPKGERPQYGKGAAIGAGAALLAAVVLPR